MKGYVNLAYKKDYNGKLLYSFKIKNDEAWYSCGTDNPKVDKNDYIEFEWTEGNNGNKYVDVSSIQFLKKAGTAEVAHAPTKRAWTPANNASKDKYWEDKAITDKETQKRIQLQASRNSAINLADLLIKNGAIKIPEKISARMDVIKALVYDLTAEFEAQVASAGLQQAFVEMEKQTPLEDPSGDDGDGTWETA